jgi:hypothetical protein
MKLNSFVRELREFNDDMNCNSLTTFIGYSKTELVFNGVNCENIHQRADFLITLYKWNGRTSPNMNGMEVTKGFKESIIADFKQYFNLDVKTIYCIHVNDDKIVIETDVLCICMKTDDDYFANITEICQEVSK